MELPEEIVREIQLRLPVKSLVRFMCVSKHWLSSITDPKFTRLHLNHLRDQQNHHYNHANSTTNSSFPQSSVILSNFFTIRPIGPCGLSMVRNQVKVKLKIRCIGGGYREDGFEEAVNFDFPLIQGQDLYIKSVCDGLVCLVIGRTTLVVWNPSIRQHRILPLPHCPGDSHADFEIFGLGYDSTIDDYKVVRLPSSICRVQVIGAYFMPGKCLLQAQVFNLKSNNWRSIQDFPYIIGEHHQTSISVQGGLHWLAVLDHDPKHLVLRFDLADETFSEIALPPHLESVNSRFLSLGLWGGFLSMLRDSEFWVMKGDGEQGWTKVMTIPHVQAPQDSSYTSLAKPLCLTNSGKVLIVVACKKLVLYDPRELAVRELNIRSLPDAFFKDTLYLESLVSPCSGNV